MPIIEWKDCYLVGIQEIDLHHKDLVQSLNKNYDRFREGAELEVSLLQELLDYSVHHLRCEEGWMEKTSYPKLASHMEEHRQFSSKISELKKQSLNAYTSIELLWFLCNWVTHHMGETDAEFGKFISARQNLSR